MQRAFPGSLLAHAAIIGVGLVGFAWPQPDDAPAAESVNVSIVAMSSVSINATELVQSDATENLVASGTSAPAVEPVAPATIEPVSDAITPLQPETPQPALAESEPPAEQTTEALVPAEPVSEVALLRSSAVASLTSQPLAATPVPTIEPVTSADLNAAPVPRTLSFERASEPTTPKPAPQQPKPTPPKPPAQSGNSGANTADAVAAVAASAPQAGGGNGGDAETARYPGEVLRKLRRALRSGNGPGGEVVVRFTVLANGQVAAVSIGRSSGNAAVDQAGLATVGRAAPFPPIPTAANRSDWTFDVPLAFGG